MKSKNIINKADIMPKTPGNKKQNVNVNTYMKKSKRTYNNENPVDNIIPEPEPKPEPIIQLFEPDIIKPNIKALNLIKAREARQINIQNKNISREEKILNLINEIKEEELLKIENKTEKLKNKLMKLI